MSTVLKSDKSRILTIIALIGLFFTRWVFCRIELVAQDSYVIFIIESILFILIYGLSIFNIPLVIPAFLSLIGCVLIGLLYFLLDGYESKEFLCSFTYFFVLFYYVEQLYYLKNKGDSMFLFVVTLINRFFPFIFAVLAVVFMIDKDISFNINNVYIILIFIIPAVIYYFISRVGAETNKKKKRKSIKKNDNKELQSMRVSFAYSIIPIVFSGVFFALNENKYLSHTIPIVWIVNLILLYSMEHALVRGFVSEIQIKLKDFLLREKNENE